LPRRRLVGFDAFENVDNAVSKLLKVASLSPGVTEAPIEDSVGRVAAEDVRATRHYPPHDRAAMDGVAVRAEDVVSASPHSPIELRIVETVEAGGRPTRALGCGEAAIVYTGAPLPEGADAVVPFENVIIRDDTALVLKPVPKYGNVSRAGEDFSEGDILVRRGEVIRPWHVAALAESCIGRVKVFSPVKVAVVNTGSELTDYRACSGGEAIVNSSGPLISAYVAELGCSVVYSTIVKDDVKAIREAVLNGLHRADVVVTTGGSSVGGKDLVPEAVSSIEGAELVFHGVNLRPGRTAGAFVVRGKPVLMLSGLPVACFVGLENFLKPLILKAYGVKQLPRPTVRAVLTRRVANAVGFRSYYRVVVFRGSDGRLYAEPLRLTGSGIISSMIRGNGLLVLSEDMEGFDEGEEVEVELLSPPYESKPEFLRW